MTDPRQARKTALLVGGVLALLAAWNAYRGRRLPTEILSAAAGALFLVGLLLPSWAARFHKAWMGLASVLGYVNSRILLSLVFFLVITPFRLALLLFGRNPLLRRGPSRQTYWVPRSLPRQPRERFEHPF